MFSLKKVDSLEDFALCHAIRKEVFVDEQGVSLSVEFDEFEESSEHFLASYQGEVCGVARLRRKGLVIKFERIAIKAGFRAQGLGTQLLLALMAYKEKNHASFGSLLHAQVGLRDFYLNLGWELVEGSSPFYEGGLEHLAMQRAMQ